MCVGGEAGSDTVVITWPEECGEQGAEWLTIVFAPSPPFAQKATPMNLPPRDFSKEPPPIKPLTNTSLLCVRH